MIRLIRRRLRARTPVVAAFSPLIVVVMFLFASNIFMDSQSLTRSQEADESLGDAALSITMFDLEIPAGVDAGDTLRDNFERQNSDFSLSVNAIEFPYYQSGLAGAFYTEKDWDRSSPDRQFSLLSGRWPRSAGEVTVAGHNLSDVRVGDEVRTPGGGQSLDVVGVAQRRFSGETTILAAPGTWSSMSVGRQDDAGLLTAFATFESRSHSTDELVAGVSSALRLSRPGQMDSSGEDELREKLHSGIRTRAMAAAEVARPWTTQSPLSLWVPGMFLVPVCLLIGYFILMRRLIPAAQRMVAQGVSAEVASTATWLVPMPMIVLLVVSAAIIGTVAGYQIAEVGAGRWGYFIANPRTPVAALWICGVGAAASTSAALVAIRSRVSRTRRLQIPLSIQNHFDATRQTLAGLAGCALLWQLLTIDEPSDGMFLTGLGALTLAMLTPEIVSLMVRVMPQKTLTQRLVARQVSTNHGRVAAAMGVYIVMLAVTVGVLTVLHTQVGLIRERQPISVPPGHLLVDTNSTPFKRPAPEVLTALETVSTLRDQRPIQLHMVGERVTDPQTGFEDAINTAGTRDLPGISYAFDSVEDLQSAVGRALSVPARAVLEEGGVLVVNPEQVVIRRGQIVLMNNTARSEIAEVKAMAITPAPTRWTSAVPSVLLRSTAQELGLPTQPAAVLYVGVGPDDARLARNALVEAGYSPKLIGTSEPPPPVVPPAALAGSALGLLLLVSTVSLLATRAQVRSMRVWASRLTHLGVQMSWAKRALRMQFMWVLFFSVPPGLLVALGALELTRARLPGLDVIFPWSQIAFVVLVVLLATAMGASMASRKLSEGLVSEKV